MIVVLASQDSFPCGPKGRFRFWRRGAAIPPALGSRVSRTLTKRAGGSGRATDSQFRCSGSRSQDRLSRACWPACVPSDPWTLGFPTQDLSRAPRPSSLLFLCPSYSNFKARFLKIVDSWRRDGARFPTQTAKFREETGETARQLRKQERRWPPRARGTRASKWETQRIAGPRPSRLTRWRLPPEDL